MSKHLHLQLLIIWSGMLIENVILLHITPGKVNHKKLFEWDPKRICPHDFGTENKNFLGLKKKVFLFSKISKFSDS